MDRANDLTCRELVELLTEYLDGALPPAERARFEEHLVLCPGCTYHLDQLRTTIRIVGELREEAVPDEVSKAFLTAFRNWRVGEGRA